MIPVSVVISVYNSESFLFETIDSVLNQSFEDFELLLLDDGSTDRTPEIIRSYNDRRIRYFRCKNDFFRTANKGIRLAQGKYIALLGHDDIMVPDRLKIQYDFMEANPDIAACGGYLHTFDKSSYIWRRELSPDMVMFSSLTQIPIFSPTGFIRREILTKHKIKHRKEYSFAEDFKFWTDILKVGKLANIPEILILYRVSDNQLSAVHKDDISEASIRIQFEMFEYFLSHIDRDNPAGKKAFRQWASALRKMSESGYFSTSVFFDFLHKMVLELFKVGIIKISGYEQ